MICGGHGQWQKFRSPATGTVHVRRRPTDARFVCGVPVPSYVERTSLYLGMCEMCRRAYSQRHG